MHSPSLNVIDKNHPKKSMSILTIAKKQVSNLQQVAFSGMILFSCSLTIRFSMVDNDVLLDPMILDDFDW